MWVNDYGGVSPSAEVEERVLDSVRNAPHLSTRRRPETFGISTGTAHKVPVARGLSKLNARLELAGYRVEACKSLAVAGQRRIVATYPGSLTHIDYETFGYLRSPRRAPRTPGKRLGGFLVVDSLTAFAHLAKLVSLGIVKLDDEWTVRLMGSSARPGGTDRDDAPEYADTDAKALPFALVMQRKKLRDIELTPDLTEPAPTALGKPPRPDGDSGSLVVLAK